MTNFPLVACVVTHTQEVIPGLNTPAFMFTRVWRAPEKKQETVDTLIMHVLRYYFGHVFWSVLLLHVVQNMQVTLIRDEST